MLVPLLVVDDTACADDNSKGHEVLMAIGDSTMIMMTVVMMVMMMVVVMVVVGPSGEGIGGIIAIASSSGRAACFCSCYSAVLQASSCGTVEQRRLEARPDGASRETPADVGTRVLLSRHGTPPDTAGRRHRLAMLLPERCKRADQEVDALSRCLKVA